MNGMNAPTILLAEDEDDFRRALGKFLFQHGFNVVPVEDGYQALEFAIRDLPDLLVLDVHMPAGDGFSVHDRVQRHPELALKPVVYMTHDPGPEIECMAREHGAIALLHKPFDAGELVRVIRVALDLDEVSEAA